MFRPVDEGPHQGGSFTEILEGGDLRSDGRKRTADIAGSLCRTGKDLPALLYCEDEGSLVEQVRGQIGGKPLLDIPTLAV